MNRIKRRLSIALLFIMSFLCACGSPAAAGKQAAPAALPASAAAADKTEPEEEIKMEPGYVPSVIDFPDWLEKSNFQGLMGYLGGRCCFYGDLIFMTGKDPVGELAAGYYDTVNDSWHRLDRCFEGEPDLNITCISADENAVWILANRFDDSAKEMNWYLSHSDLAGGENSGWYKIGFYGEDRNSIYSEFSNVLSLGPDRALLFTRQKCYEMDAEGNVISQPDLPPLISHHTAKGQTYFSIFSENGGGSLRLFNRAELTLGESKPVREGTFVSQRDRFITSGNNGLCELNMETGEEKLIFLWMDVCLRVDEAGTYGTLENSEGNFFFTSSDRIIKITPAMVKAKKPLTLAVFGDTSNLTTELNLKWGDSASTLTPELRNAIVFFNNTDPDYRIELKYMSYGSEQKRDRFLIELATDSRGIDLIDTGLLPEGALDSGLLTDMLPFLDADEAVKREDFIPTLFSAMQRGGCLYEFMPRFEIVSVAVAEKDYPGKELWTADFVRRLISDNPGANSLNPRYRREHLIRLFAEAASAEFINWDDASCCFDDGRFAAWLSMLRYAEDNRSERVEPGQREMLVDPLLSVSTNVPGHLRRMLGDDYVLAGFPEASGTGSYWIRLPAKQSLMDNDTMGTCTRVGIMAGSENKDGAWRFVRCLMLDAGPNGLCYGIPVNKKCFEEILAAERSLSDSRVSTKYIQYPVISEEDAEELREIVYGSDRIVRSDEVLLSMLQGEIGAFLAGQKSADEAALQIQKRAGIYVAEQS